MWLEGDATGDLHVTRAVVGLGWYSESAAEVDLEAETTLNSPDRHVPRNLNKLPAEGPKMLYKYHWLMEQRGSSCQCLF